VLARSLLLRLPETHLLLLLLLWAGLRNHQQGVAV
jgi:hypothetical protein